MRDIFVDYVYKEIQNDENVILLTADLGFGIFDKFDIFRNKQYFNVGVCEQLMASMAAGMSSEGFKLYIYSLGVFPTMRCLEQIRNDISYHELEVSIVSSGAGFSYGALGMSHHCVQDIGIMRSIPGVKVISPANDFEMKKALDINEKIKYIRICKSKLNLNPIEIKNNPIEPICYHKSHNLDINNKTLIIGHGSITEIASPLINDFYSFDLYTLPILEVSENLIALIKKYKKIITIEEHSEVNGFSSFISSLITKHQIKINMKIIALAHEHCSVVGDQKYLRERLGLTTEKLKESL